MSAAPLFDVVVPVKPLPLAKSRLVDLPAHVSRPDLVRAFALDVLVACRAATSVRTTYVVTDDVDLSLAAEELGARRLPDAGDGDLNRALVRAVAGLPGDAGVAALLGDLPCLRADDLTSLLAHVEAAGTVVPDSAGTGSTMVAVTDAARFDPHFGEGSFRAHLDAGYVAALVAPLTLRRDVDTADDLAAARALGLGPHTSSLLDGPRTPDGR